MPDLDPNDAGLHLECRRHLLDNLTLLECLHLLAIELLRRSHNGVGTCDFPLLGRKVPRARGRSRGRHVRRGRWSLRWRRGIAWGGSPVVRRGRQVMLPWRGALRGRVGPISPPCVRGWWWLFRRLFGISFRVHLLVVGVTQELDIGRQHSLVVGPLLLLPRRPSPPAFASSVWHLPESLARLSLRCYSNSRALLPPARSAAAAVLAAVPPVGWRSRSRRRCRWRHRGGGGLGSGGDCRSPHISALLPSFPTLASAFPPLPLFVSWCSCWSIRVTRTLSSLPHSTREQCLAARAVRCRVSSPGRSLLASHPRQSVPDPFREGATLVLQERL